MEIAEVASMAMELFSMEYWAVFFEKEADLNRAKEHQLERVITIFPWIATIDKFQHWIYENPFHNTAERTSRWMEILNEFSTSAIDFSSLDGYRQSNWQRQLHLFEVPFYYIEYGIAQLGAIGLWMQFKQDKDAALNNYMLSLSKGGILTLPELYKTAGIEFNFSSEYIKNLMNFVKGEIVSIAGN